MHRGRWGDYTAVGRHLWPTQTLTHSPSYILRTASARTDRGNGPGVISGRKMMSHFGRWRQDRGAHLPPRPSMVGAPGGCWEALNLPPPTPSISEAGAWGLEEG